VIHYRTFRNTDPPRLVEVWNETFTGRGAVRLRTSTALERFVLAKPYFDPAGLIIAEQDGHCAGFAHAGFGAGERQAGVSCDLGAICMIGVRPGFRRRGIGTELLRQAEAYLRQRGARTILAGPHAPCNAFYLGLYGGSDLPGFLTSDLDADPFLTRHGYRVQEQVLVLQRALSEPVRMIDPRFSTLRQSYELRVGACKNLGCWWQECVFSPVETLEFFLENKSGGEPAARTLVWEMEGFSERWSYPAVGIVNCEVQASRRRRGFGKFLLSQVLRQVQEQYFEIAEVQVPEANGAALALFRGLGFAQVDVGRVYVRS
jgi:ribosomal protein S18 acetylase RimI-like enzyme